MTVFWDTGDSHETALHSRQKGGCYTCCQSQPWQKKSMSRAFLQSSPFAELDKNTGNLWFTLSCFQGRFDNRLHSVTVWSCVLPLDKHLVFWQIAFMGTLFLDQHFSTNSTWSFFEPSSRSDSWLWCAAGLSPLALLPPAIIYVLYFEGVNKSRTAPLSVSSVSEASTLAFCRVIYARLLPKMSFLYPTAPSACERARHLSVFINFKDATACFCHSLCCFLSILLLVFFLFSKSVALSHPLRLSLRFQHIWCHFSLYPFLSLLLSHCSTRESVRETSSLK